MATHLLKLVHFLTDAEGYRTELWFLRDLDGREVDFLVTESGKPWFAVEVKVSDRKPGHMLRYFSSRISIPYSYLVVDDEDCDLNADGVRVIGLAKFLAGLV